MHMWLMVHMGHVMHHWIIIQKNSLPINLMYTASYADAYKMNWANAQKS